MAVRRPGCPFCRKEAKELSTLKPDLDSAGIRLMAVVHETLGVNEFKPFFDGDVYYDKDVSTSSILYIPSSSEAFLWS